MALIGCREGNGRCFKRAGWAWRLNAAYLQFHDGSTYLMTGLTQSDWVLDFIFTTQPGCAFNKDWKLKPNVGITKLTSPLPDADVINRFHANPSGRGYLAGW